MANLQSIKSRLRLPAIAAPMFLVSGPAMVMAACQAGIVGSFPGNNARSLDQLDEWLAEISARAAEMNATWAMNVMVHRSYVRFPDEMALILKHKPPIVITALGSPKAAVSAIQAYGGLVYADVNSLTYARKAAEAGVDGLVLVSAGAGGHTGPIAGFAFVPAVRQFFSGAIVLGGGIGSGQAIRAAEVLGADFAYLGTRLIACEESLAHPDYKQMLIEASAEDVVLSDALTGVAANWLRASVVKAGFDPDKMGQKAEINLGRPEDNETKRWRDVWSAGHGVGEVTSVEPLSVILDQLAAEYEAAGQKLAI